MNYNALVTLLLGIALLTMGRKMFWLFVAAAGFVAGIELAPRLLAGQQEWIYLVVALGLGVLGALLAILLQKVAIAIAGFVLGAYAVWLIVTILNLPLHGLPLYVAALVGGIIGLILVVMLFDVALILLSSIAGANLILSVMTLDVVSTEVIFIVLVLVGIAIQFAIWRRYDYRRVPASP